MRIVFLPVMVVALFLPPSAKALVAAEPRQPVHVHGDCPDFRGNDAKMGLSPSAVRKKQIEKMLLDYYQQMSIPKPLVVRSGNDWKAHQAELRRCVARCAGLDPLPERIPLDVHGSPSLDHPWCTVRRIAYQLWPGVYSTGLLYMPKRLEQRPAPAMLCPHGHWSHGTAEPDVQRRCLNLARLGYVTFCSTQNHYEDLPIGVSHQTLMIWNNMRALDYLESLPEVDRTRIGVAGASGGGLQSQMLVVDLAGASFAGQKLSLVSGVLQHGDVLQWAALAADRSLTIRNVPVDAGSPDWLRAAFAAAGNLQGLSIAK